MATAEIEQPEVEQPETGEEPEPEITEEDAAEQEEGAQEEGEPASRQRVPSSETVLQVRDKAITAETKRHEKALQKAYGDDWSDLHPCPLCLTDGYVIPAPPGAFPDEQWLAVEMAAGKDQAAAFEPDPSSELCPNCKGGGKLDTGARTGDLAIRICGKCNGNGWIDKPLPLAAVPPWQPPPSVPGEDLSHLDWTRPKDEFGRPEGHPRFGVNPQYNGGVW